jgi:hypothetical protein
MTSVKSWTGNPFQVLEGKPLLAEAANETGSWKTAVNAPKLILYSNNLVVGQGTVAGDLIPCVFTGYAPILTVPIPLADANGNNMLSAVAPTAFVAGAIGTPDIAYGWAMIDGATGDLLAVENFDAPFNFAEVGDTINLEWRYYFPGLDPISNPGS